MMDPLLIKAPSSEKWLALVKEILAGKKDIDLNKLGGAGPFIKNIFLHTNEELLAKSIEDFFNVFKALLKKYNEANELPNAEEILLLISVAYTFSKREKIKSYEKNMYEAGLKNTSSPFYFSQLTALVSNYVKASEPNNLIDNQAVVYDYLLYLKRSYAKLLKGNYLNRQQMLSIKKILKASVGINEKHASLANFLLYSLDENDQSLPKKSAITESIIQYCIASKNVTNKLLNNLILDFARLNNESFNAILDNFNCNLSSDGFTILYADQSFKDLEPGKEEWEYLNDLYNLNTTPVNEILKQHLTRSIVSN